VRNALIPQRFIVPAASVQAHKADFQQSDRMITQVSEQFGVNSRVVMPASARAFVGPIMVGQSGQGISRWINPSRQLMGQPANNTFMMGARFHDQAPLELSS
jgi:hypothetical protein